MAHINQLIHDFRNAISCAECRGESRKELQEHLRKLEAAVRQPRPTPDEIERLIYRAASTQKQPDLDAVIAAVRQLAVSHETVMATEIERDVARKGSETYQRAWKSAEKENQCIKAELAALKQPCELDELINCLCGEVLIVGHGDHVAELRTAIRARFNAKDAEIAELKAQLTNARGNS